MTTLRIALPARAVASRVLDASALLLHPSADEVKICNAVGTRLWQLICEARHTEDELAAILVAEYEVELEVARIDVREFLSSLETAGFLSWR